MRKPDIVDIRWLLTNGCQACWKLPDGSEWWGPARAFGFNQINPLGRLKAAWMVFTGQADALTWPE